MKRATRDKLRPAMSGWCDEAKAAPELLLTQVPNIHSKRYFSVWSMNLGDREHSVVRFLAAGLPG